MSNVTELDDLTFDGALQEPGIVLIDFWADWCAPCHAMAPILEELADEYSGQLRIAKIDVQRFKEIADRFEIRSLPTLIVFANGEPVSRLAGSKRAPQLRRELDQALGTT